MKVNFLEDDAKKKDAPAGRSPIGAAADNYSSSEPNTVFFSAEGLRPFWGLLIYLAILFPAALYLVMAEASHPASSRQQISPFSSGPQEWMLLGVVFFATWVMSRIEDRSVFDYGLQLSRLRSRWFITGALWGLFFMSLFIAILWSTHHLIFADLRLHALPTLGYGIAWAVSFLGVGFFEELLFRGYLQFNLTRCFAGLIRWIVPRSRLADSAGFWIAAVLLSFGFGFVHKTNPGESPIGLLCAGCASLLFAFSLWRTGSLWWAIGLHTAWDWAQSFLFGVADSGVFSQGRLLQSHPAGSALMSGGLTGPEGSLFVLPVMLLIALVIALTLRRDPMTSAPAPWATTPSGPASTSTLA